MTASASDKPKVLIIGLDGATFDNIRPWAEAGRLPTFARLMKEGVHGALRSSIPPITAPAWTSFMTGKNPGKHGLYNFVEPQPGSYKIRYANARSRVGRTLWEILSAASLRVGSINVPMTYPPDPVNGYMISGMDSPEGSTAITHPPELYAELATKFDRVSKQIRYLGFLKTDERRDSVIETLREADDHYVRMTEYLLAAHPTDVAMVVFTSTDTVQHFFYHYMDESHPQFDGAGAARYKDAIFDVYLRMDHAIARLMNGLAEDGTLVLMSDHGFHASSGRVVHLNRYLEDLGLLRRSGKSLSGAARPAMKVVDKLLRESLPPQWKARIADRFPSLRRKWESQYGGFADVDWKNTRAFCYEVLTFPPGIWINRKGVHPDGIVADGAEYEELLDLITAKLYELKDPVTGQRLITRVLRKEEAYHGSQLAQAPDLSLAWWEGVSFVAKQSSDSRAAVEYRGGQPIAAGEWSGVHAMDGIYLFHGKSFRRGLTLDSEITDVTPTLLYLLGQPVPEDIDGRVLLEAFTEEHTARHGLPARRDSGSGDSSKRTERTYSEDESDQVAERLRGLGYIE